MFVRVRAQIPPANFSINNPPSRNRYMSDPVPEIPFLILVRRPSNENLHQVKEIDEDKLNSNRYIYMCVCVCVRMFVRVRLNRNKG